VHVAGLTARVSPNAHAAARHLSPYPQVEALTNTLTQMQATNTAFATSLRGADSEVAQEQQRALRWAQ
jgi:hypothetical protein